MYGGRFAGLRVFNLVTRRWRSPEHPHAVEHVSPLPNGTVAVCSSNSGVQLLSLDDRSSPFSRSTLALSMSTFDQDRIIAFCPPTRDAIQFLETSTMSELTAIHAPDDSTIPLTTVLCASLLNRMVVCYPQRSGIQRLQLYEFGDELPRWTAGTSGCPSVCGISPNGTQIVTFHDAKLATRICMWDAKDGQLQAGLLTPPHHIRLGNTILLAPQRLPHSLRSRRGLPTQCPYYYPQDYPPRAATLDCGVEQEAV